MLIALLLAATLAVPTPDNTLAQGEALALRAACGRNPDCRARRATEAKAVAATVLDACGLHMPRRECLTLVATLAESRMLAYPTCSPERCRQLCGMDASGGSRRIKCAAAVGDRAHARSSMCNDRGTSRGWFQMKRVLTRACSRSMGHPIDPHDLGQAAHCYAWIVGRSYRANRCGVVLPDKRWGVSFARVAAGPFKRGLVAGHLLRLPRCTPHGYARRWRARQAIRTAQWPRAVRK